jgi:ERCC4-type nuclease
LVAINLVSEFGSVSSLMGTKEENLQKVLGIGSLKANSIFNAFQENFYSKSIQ